MMITVSLKTGLLALGALLGAGLASGGAACQPSFSSGAPSVRFCDMVSKGPVLYRNDDAWIRQAKLTLIGQYQGAAVSPAGSNRFCSGSGGHDGEWRRAYLGADILMGDGTWRLSNLTNVGGLEGRHREVREEWTGSHTEWSLYELYLEKTMPGIKLKAGKVTPQLTVEYGLPSTRIKTVERSAICNELIPVSNWGLEAHLQKNPASLCHSYGVYLNANGTDLKDELQFHAADNIFAMISMKWNVPSPAWDRQSLGWQYAHNFTEWRGRKISPGSDYCGPGAQDIVSLEWNACRGKLEVMGNLIAGMGIVGHPGATNVYGLVLQPSYRLSPHWEGVFQYQCSFGDDSVRLNNRYVPAVTRYPAWVDSMHSFYLGMNYDVCPRAVHAMKLMCGVEYVTSRADTPVHAFNGWALYGALRFKF